MYGMALSKVGVFVAKRALSSSLSAKGACAWRSRKRTCLREGEGGAHRIGGADVCAVEEWW